MEFNQLSHYLHKFEQFVKSVESISGTNLVTCIVKPPNAAQKITSFMKKHCNGDLFEARDFTNGVFACLGKPNKKSFYKMWEPWWPIKTSLTIVGKRFSTEDIVQAVPETLHGIIIIRQDDAILATLGNNYKHLSVEATRNLSSAKIKKAVPLIKNVSGLHIFHQANVVDIDKIIHELSPLDPELTPKVHRFEEGQDMSIERSSIFDRIPCPVVKDLMAIRAIIDEPTKYCFGPSRVIEIVQKNNFDGYVFIWKENNLRMHKYCSEDAVREVRFVFSDGKVENRLQEEVDGRRFSLQQGHAPKVLDHLQTLMARSPSHLRIIMADTARDSPFVTEFHGLAATVKTYEQHLEGLLSLQ